MNTKEKTTIASRRNLSLGLLALGQCFAIALVETSPSSESDRASSSESVVDENPEREVEISVGGSVGGKTLASDAGRKEVADLAPTEVATVTLGELGFDVGGLLPRVGDALTEPEFFDGFAFKMAERFDRRYWDFYERAGLSEQQVDAVRDAVGLRFVEMAEGMAVGMGDPNTPMASSFGVLDGLAADSEQRLQERLGDDLYEDFVEYEMQLPFRNAFAEVEEEFGKLGLSLDSSQSEAYALTMMENLQEKSINDQMAFAFASVDPSRSARLDGEALEALSAILSSEQMEAWRNWKQGAGQLAREGKRQPWVDVARRIRGATR